MNVAINLDILMNKQPHKTEYLSRISRKTEVTASAYKRIVFHPNDSKDDIVGGYYDAAPEPKDPTVQNHIWIKISCTEGRYFLARAALGEPYNTATLHLAHPTPERPTTAASKLEHAREPPNPTVEPEPTKSTTLSYQEVFLRDLTVPSTGNQMESTKNWIPNGAADFKTLQRILELSEPDNQSGTNQKHPTVQPSKEKPPKTEPSKTEPPMLNNPNEETTEPETTKASGLLFPALPTIADSEALQPLKIRLYQKAFFREIIDQLSHTPSLAVFKEKATVFHTYFIASSDARLKDKSPTEYLQVSLTDMQPLFLIKIKSLRGLYEYTRKADTKPLQYWRLYPFNRKLMLLTLPLTRAIKKTTIQWVADNFWTCNNNRNKKSSSIHQTITISCIYSLILYKKNP